MTPADLLPQVYQELRKLAQVKLDGENPGHTLDATALVHEVYLKLAPRDSRGLDGRINSIFLPRRPDRRRGRGGNHF